MSAWLTGKLARNAGPLAAAAQAFLAAKLGEKAQDFRGGSAGIVFLCEEILRFMAADHASEEDERRFIEGAGALLALLLIDHLGDGSHVVRGTVHRIRLGKYGFFD